MRGRSPEVVGGADIVPVLDQREPVDALAPGRLLVEEVDHGKGLAVLDQVDPLGEIREAQDAGDVQEALRPRLDDVQVLAGEAAVEDVLEDDAPEVLRRRG